MTGENDGEAEKPGPEPERLKLPEENWKEALRRALGIAPPAEGESDEEGDAEEECANG